MAVGLNDINGGICLVPPKDGDIKGGGKAVEGVVDVDDGVVFVFGK